ncbi:chromatin remodeling protein EBS-like [Daucus carota subsp. sativus]|uniref:chromatin remodeling protein EBS-like n=1 Tax=Daucus carota subsp. sativus TaxID=79200 RepID=UPI003083EB29
MAATPNNRPVDFYVIQGTREVIRAGDCVFMKSLSAPSSVARVEKLQADRHGNVEFELRWYYKPEHTLGRRRSFHGEKELFMSDHFDTRDATIITGKCNIYSVDQYARLKHVGPEDFYSRFQYQHVYGIMTPVRVKVFCKCELPYNPDELTLPCSTCDDRFHPMCIGMTLEQIKKLTHYICDECSYDDCSTSSEYPLAMMDANKNVTAASSKISSSASSTSVKGLKRACSEQDTLVEEDEEVLGDQAEGMDENEV